MWAKVHAMNDTAWNNYRAFRDDQQERIFARLKEYYSHKKAFTADDAAAASADIMPRAIPAVPDDVRRAAQVSMERLRGVVTSFVKQPGVPEDQANIIRQWAAKADTAAAALPQAQKDLLQHAKLAAANLVMQDMNHRFINYLTRTNFDATMAKTLFPFWMYDFHGAHFYGWMLSHVPGASESYAREVMATKDSPQGVGYFPGDFGAFGNNIGINRGLWDYRAISWGKYLTMNRPADFSALVNQEFQRALSDGLFGARLSPAVASALQLSTGQQLGDLSWPPMINMAGDAIGMAAGNLTGQVPVVGNIIGDIQTATTNNFDRQNIGAQVLAQGGDPYHPTPDQQTAAVKTAAGQDLASQSLPMFTRIPPERIAQRKEFDDYLVNNLGYTRQQIMAWKNAHPNLSPFAMVNKEQGAKMMDEHPGWKYLFEESTLSLPPEELTKRIEMSDQLEQLNKLTKDRLDAQAKIDNQLLGTKDKASSISPQQWMDQRSTLMNRYLGAKDNFTSYPAWQTVQNQLDDPAKQKIFLATGHAEDLARQQYYVLQADLIKKNTGADGKINWQAVTQGTDEFISTLTPYQQQYVNNEIVKNQTPVERTWKHALELKSQYDAIPPWTGMSPDQAQRKKDAMTRLNQLLNDHTANGAAIAAAYDRQNHNLIHSGQVNPQRIKWMLQPQNADYTFWFGKPTVKNKFTNLTLDPSELAPWEYSPPTPNGLTVPDESLLPLAGGG